VAFAIAMAKKLFAALGLMIDAGEAFARIADHFVLVWLLHEEAWCLARIVTDMTCDAA
jgi:hypothetical protein